MRKTIVAVLLVVVALPILADQRERNIGTIYHGLGALGCGERRQAYLGYSREQQLELWTLHLQKFLTDHPNLTSTQRTVVLEGLELIASGALDRTDDPKVTRLVQAFKERAQLQFDRNTFKDAFVRLGGRRDSAAGVQRAERVATLQPFCDCERDEECGGTDDCNFLRPCTEVIACGPFGTEWCLGVCE